MKSFSIRNCKTYWYSTLYVQFC